MPEGNWKDDEVRELLLIRGEVEIVKQMDGTCRSSMVYGRVSELLQARGVHRTKKQVISKLKLLKKQYTGVIDHNSRSGRDRKTMPFFELCDLIWGNRPGTRPIAVQSSMSRAAAASTSATASASASTSLSATTSASTSASTASASASTSLSASTSASTSGLGSSVTPSSAAARSSSSTPTSGLTSSGGWICADEDDEEGERGPVVLEYRVEPPHDDPIQLHDQPQAQAVQEDPDPIPVADDDEEDAEDGGHAGRQGGQKKRQKKKTKMEQAASAFGSLVSKQLISLADRHEAQEDRRSREQREWEERVQQQAQEAQLNVFREMRAAQADFMQQLLRFAAPQQPPAAPPVFQPHPATFQPPPAAFQPPPGAPAAFQPAPAAPAAFQPPPPAPNQYWFSTPVSGTSSNAPRRNLLQDLAPSSPLQEDDKEDDLSYHNM